MRDNWNAESASQFNLKIDENKNTTIIIDDTFGFVTSYKIGIAYIRAILTISRRHSLSWKLKKCHFFPEQVEFVGHDITKQGNTPTTSKIPLLSSWPIPKTARDISSFNGFSNAPYFIHPWMEIFKISSWVVPMNITCIASV